MAVVFSAVTPFSAGTINFVINMALLVVGFACFGREFGAKTVYVSVLMSLGLSGLEKYYPMARPMTNEPVLELVFAIVLPALSSAILFNIGASGGGTDIIAMVLKKHSTVNIGTALFLVDLMITVAACFIFDAATGLFSFCGLMAKSLVIDTAMKELGSKAASCVYVGDSDVDLATAENAGIPCISVSWGFRDREFLLQNGAKRIADTMDDIWKILADL